ncbi:MAG TPA: AAA family ATPase [Bryobacteraceae bacterium]|nr:AAA family ATPase [Bryobacteraceae bacterium]
MATGESKAPNELVELLSQKVIGQPNALKFIVPYIEMYQAGLAPEGRPVGVFLLLGPTGTGKTRTVEVLAEVLHGSQSNYLRIDCGEFQIEHEVAKLVGAPPGYLGHRETQPMLSQQKLASVTSERSDLALVLFDEIEKAAPSLTRLLLGILDKATLRLGDNTAVNFEKTLIFLTSNLGAREMMKELNPSFGFQPGTPRDKEELGSKLESIALAAVRKKFSPEFVNRIDAVVTYRPLDAESLATILDQQIGELQQHVNTRLGARCFRIEVTPESRKFLLEKGTSQEYGARELKRTIHRFLTQPLATLVASGQIEPGAHVAVEVDSSGDRLQMRTVAVDTPAQPAPANPTVLIVDDNRDLLRFLEHLMVGAHWRILTAETGQQALAAVASQTPDAALLDYMLPDLNGLELALQIQKKLPRLQIILMTGANLAAEEELVCRQNGFPLLQKPFLAQDIMSLIRNRLSGAAACPA